MGDNVTRFPEPPGRSWRALEQGVRDGLLETGSTPDEAEHVCRVLQPIWEAASSMRCGDASGGGDGAVKIVNDWATGLATFLLVEIARREATLFQHGLANSVA